MLRKIVKLESLQGGLEKHLEDSVESTSGVFEL